MNRQEKIQALNQLVRKYAAIRDRLYRDAIIAEDMGAESQSEMLHLESQAVNQRVRKMVRRLVELTAN